MNDARSVALAFQDHIGAGDLEGALALASDDAVFTTPMGDEVDKDGLRALFASIGPVLAGPMVAKILGVTSEGDRVAIEMTGSAPLKNGKAYNNRYHLLFIVTDGKIRQMKEYCDTQAVSVLFS